MRFIFRLRYPELVERTKCAMIKPMIRQLAVTVASNDDKERVWSFDKLRIDGP